MTAHQAIERSISRTEIVTLPYSPEALKALEGECEDSVHGNTVTEFWGTDADGCAWRVHVLDSVP
jgi:hypothetical protein